jgi:peptidoglycan/LPS O-acetylase OafA/YrhL
MSLRSTNYRPDIDGLRTVAVLSVVFFHLGWQWIPGGYIGVDLFFVISGYLITKILRDEIDRTGTLDFRAFYLRRARRLFPALFIALVGTTIAAAILFSPQHMERYGGELASAVLSVSNFYFHMESGYFDTEGLFKPLLHTWSLGVEEQFYLVWPVAMLLTIRYARGAWAPGVILLLSLTTLAASQFLVSRGEEIFFLTPLRMFEFGIGALLVWVIYRPSNAVSEASVVAGLALIAGSALLYTEATPFPSAYALMPCIGAVLVIFGGNALYSGWLLRNPVSVWIGLISYSLYLVHWPIVVFYNLTIEGAVDAEGNAVLAIPFAMSLVLLAVMILLAWAMYAFVEQPFRGGGARRGFGTNARFVTGAAVSAAVLTLTGAHAYATGGWLWRLDTEQAAMMALVGERKSLPTDKCEHRAIDDTALWDECLSESGKAVIIFGDSHANDLFQALAYNLDNAHILRMGRGNCDVNSALKPKAKGCPLADVERLVEERKDQIAAVLYTESGSRLLRFKDGKVTGPNKGRISITSKYLDKLSQKGVRVYWVGPALLPMMRLDRAEPGMIVDQDELLKKQIDMFPIEKYIAGESIKHSFGYISKLKAQVDYLPHYLIVDKKFTYSDRSHWSQFGAALFGKNMLERDPELRDIFKGSLQANLGS